MVRKYVSFKDENQPLGTRKVAYVRWLMQKKGYSLEKAKLSAHRKFYHESQGS